MTRTPTAEQAAILDDAAANPADGRKVEALAGSGKTTTLSMLAGARREPGLYLAFNTTVRDDAAKRFPPHIKVSTTHQAAFTPMRMHDQRDRLSRKLFGSDVGRAVRLPRCRIPEDALGQIVLDTVARFANSVDRELAIDHVALDTREPEDVRMAALEGARALWGRMSNRRDDCPLTHDTYLKLWQLGDARINGIDWVMFDEAQDASPVMVDIVARQGIPVTWVGDPHQSIYQFRGAVNAMRLMPGRVFPLTQSFRFGESVAEVANAVLLQNPEGARPPRPLVGNPARASQVGRIPRGERHAFLSRTNAEWFAEALRAPCPVHVLGGIEDTARTLHAAWALWRTGERASRVPSIGRFQSWRALCDHAERFDDRELGFARKVVEQHREDLPSQIADLKRRHVEHEADADLVLSTVHKAKGREWSLVRLGNGFPSPADEAWKLSSPAEREAELNLLYVALTRAVDALEPNRAALDCLALAKRLPPAATRLTEVRIRRVPEPPAAAAPAEDPSGPAPRAAPPAAPGSRKAAGAALRGWSEDEDAEALSMAEQGFGAEDIAAWSGRNHAAVAVRLALLGARGSDPALPGEVLAALVPSHLSPEPRVRQRKKAAAPAAPRGRRPRAADGDTDPGSPGLAF